MDKDPSEVLHEDFVKAVRKFAPYLICFGASLLVNTFLNLENSLTNLENSLKNDFQNSTQPSGWDLRSLAIFLVPQVLIAMVPLFKFSNKKRRVKVEEGNACIWWSWGAYKGVLKGGSHILPHGSWASAMMSLRPNQQTLNEIICFLEDGTEVFVSSRCITRIVKPELAYNTWLKRQTEFQVLAGRVIESELSRVDFDTLESQPSAVDEAINGRLNLDFGEWGVIIRNFQIVEIEKISEAISTSQSNRPQTMRRKEAPKALPEPDQNWDVLAATRRKEEYPLPI